MIYLLLLALAVVLFLAELLYFRVADHFNIIDKPNQRSSHTQVTIRGGGIVFYLAALAYFICANFNIPYLPKAEQYPYFFAGLTIVVIVSFWDDIRSISGSIRSALQFFSMGLMAYELGIYNYTLWVLVVFFILAVGVLNAYNFMDGINGITGAYSIVTLISLAYLNVVGLNFTETFLPGFVFIGVSVFNFFNFRKRAKCFAGDVGSVSIAFIIIFLLATLILKTSNIYFILLLAVYGVDSVLTIILRLMRRENIFQPHRTHFYQVLANEVRIPHIIVSAIYGFIQLIINLIVAATAFSSVTNQSIIASVVLGGLGLTYLLLKPRLLAEYSSVK